MRALLDTSVVIDRVAAGFELVPASAAISVLTLGELRAGVVHAPNEALRAGRAETLAAVRAAFRALDVDLAVADRFGHLAAFAGRERRGHRAVDLLIIATAAAHERTLITLDRRQAALAEAYGFDVVSG